LDYVNPTGEISRKGQTIQEYLSADGSAMRDVARWTTVYRNDLLVAAHSVLRYTLLDKLMDAVGLPRHPSFKVIQRSAKPELSEKLTKVSSPFTLGNLF
jgi:hypothetical protein